MCKRRREDKEKSAKNPIKLDFRKLGSSMSPPSDKKKPQVQPRHLSETAIEGERTAKRERTEEYSPSPSPTKKPKHDTMASTSSSITNGAVSKHDHHHDETHKPKNSNPNIMNGPGLSPSGQYNRSPASTGLNGVHHASPILPPSFAGSIPPKGIAPPPKKSPPTPSQQLPKPHSGVNGVAASSPPPPPSSNRPNGAAFATPSSSFVSNTIASSPNLLHLNRHPAPPLSPLTAPHHVPSSSPSSSDPTTTTTTAATTVAAQPLGLSPTTRSSPTPVPLQHPQTPQQAAPAPSDIAANVELASILPKAAASPMKKADRTSSPTQAQGGKQLGAAPMPTLSPKAEVRGGNGEGPIKRGLE